MRERKREGKRERDFRKKLTFICKNKKVQCSKKGKRVSKKKNGKYSHRVWENLHTFHSIQQKAQP